MYMTVGLKSRKVSLYQGAAVHAFRSARQQLNEIADDVDDARVYGGIHWRYDQEAGNALGRAVATEVVKTHLRPVHP